MVGGFLYLIEPVLEPHAVKLLVEVGSSRHKLLTLNGADDPLRLLVAVRDLAEHDMLRVEPASDDRCDEELRAVAVGVVKLVCFITAG
jgi:hypothetical protein